MAQNKFLSRPRDKNITEMCRMCSDWTTAATAWMNEMEGACTALVLPWAADAAGPIFCGNPLHRPVTSWAEASALSKSHQDAPADSSSLQLSGSAFDTHGYELPEIPCCHLVLPTADQRSREFSNSAFHLRDSSSTVGGSANPRKRGISQRILLHFGFLRVHWTVSISVKHTQPFQTFTGESIYCSHLTVHFPCFALGDHGHGTGSRRTPKHHPDLPGPSQAQNLLLAPGRAWSVQERLLSKKLGWTNEKELQTTAPWAVMEASTSRQPAGSVAPFPGQASQPEELLEHCPIDLSSGTNFRVKRRTWLWVSLPRI